MKNLLLVDDSKEIFRMVSQAVQTFSELTWAKDLSSAREAIQAGQFDLILLDIELPDGNGIDFCFEIQTKDPLLPVFFLTNHKDLSEKVLGFSAGAEDYITKPFSPLELKARIEAKFKKIDLSQKSADFLKWEDIEINVVSQEVSVSSSGQSIPVDLTALEFKLLMYFAKRPSHVISRDDILNDIWGEDIHVYSRSVDTHVSKLRKKLGPMSHLIESIHGAGYKFSPSSR